MNIKNVWNHRLVIYVYPSFYKALYKHPRYKRKFSYNDYFSINQKLRYICLCMAHTFDGRNLAPVEVGSLPQDLQGVLYIPGGCFGFLNHQHCPFINNSFFHMSRSMAHMTQHTNPPTHLSVENGRFLLQGDHWNHRFKDEKSMHKEH